MALQEKEPQTTNHMGTSTPDAGFWRRFSIAVHAEEAAKTPTPDKEWTFWTDDWLKSERRKKIRARLLGWLLAFFIIGFGVGAGIVIWLLAKNHWDPYAAFNISNR
ncbi:hypothetical protein DTO166G5_3293 [Paecilomyces variotii]|nr:hypothetical protein DTO166G5_3293 [Paecilomyces variotii]